MINHEQLQTALCGIRYPEGIVNCPGSYCAIKGQSFFPGGKGHLGNDLPAGGIMYLGHNFDKISGFQNSELRGYEENLTWRSARTAILPHLGEENIWFTNYFMGVSKRPSNIGPLEKADGFANYESDCWDFFNLQVALQRPRIIVALGKHVVRALSPSIRLDIPSWNIAENDPFGPLRFITHDVALRHNDVLTETQIVAAYHPSYGRSAAQLANVAQDSIFVVSRI